jgi:hypothetical protein
MDTVATSRVHIPIRIDLNAVRYSCVSIREGSSVAEHARLRVYIKNVST